MNLAWKIIEILITIRLIHKSFCFICQWFDFQLMIPYNSAKNIIEDHFDTAIILIKIYELSYFYYFWYYFF